MLARCRRLGPDVVRTNRALRPTAMVRASGARYDDLAVNPSLVCITLGLALWGPASAASDPVPIQRPGSMSAPASKSEAAPDPESEPDLLGNGPTPRTHEASPELAPENDAKAASEPRHEARLGVLRGTITDTETEGAFVRGVLVELVCPCLEETRFTTTDDEGRYTFEELPAGVYTVQVTRGGIPTQRVLSVFGERDQEANLRVAPPPTTAQVEDRFRRTQRARTMVAGGGVAGVGALLMLIGAVVEQRKPDCDFGLETCDDAPRPGVTTGLAIGSGILAAGSAALIGLGVHELRRLEAEVQFDEQTVMLRLGGRF